MTDRDLLSISRARASQGSFLLFPPPSYVYMCVSAARYVVPVVVARFTCIRHCPLFLSGSPPRAHVLEKHCASAAAPLDALPRTCAKNGGSSMTDCRPCPRSQCSGEAEKRARFEVAMHARNFKPSARTSPSLGWSTDYADNCSKVELVVVVVLASSRCALYKNTENQH